MSVIQRRGAAASSGLFLSALLIAGTVGAQTPDARWQPWLGCWEPKDQSFLAPASGSIEGVICVVPSLKGTGVAVTTLTDGVPLSREHLDANGERALKTIDGCPGWETATWAADGHRLLLRSEFICGGGTKRKGSGIFAMSPEGDWIQVVGSDVGGNVGTRVARYRVSEVQMTTISEGQVVDAESVDSAGNRVLRSRSGCSGWESATWASDGRRVRLQSELTCTGGNFSGDAIYEKTPANKWIPVLGASAALQIVLASGDSLGVPRDKPTMKFALQTTRLAAGAPVTPANVLDAAKNVDSQVAEAWLSEIGQGFALNAKELVRLADAGMPTRVIDLMVALSYPKTFAINKAEPRPAGGRVLTGSYDPRTMSSYYRSSYDCDDFRYLQCGYPYLGYGLYSRYGYGGRYGNGYGYGPGYYYGQQPIIIVRNDPNPPSPAVPQGRAVNGRGYTRGSDNGGRASSSPSGGYSSPSRPASSSGSSTGESSSSGSSSSGSTGRTAKARGGN